MTETNSIQLSDDERDELLGNGGTGVISFSTATDEYPYALPVSYGYDQAEGTFYFRLTEGEKTKEELHRRLTSFVTYREIDDTWQSVVAVGQLQETTEDEIATRTLQGLERVSIPYVDIFGMPMGDVEFTFYLLDPAEITGRKEQPTDY